MFYYINGKLALLDPAYAVVDAGGVGYKLTISLTTYSHLNNKTDVSSVTLYTHMAVREDGVELYGFYSEDELDAFKMLITVSGVGPKAAISILSQLTPSRLSAAICTDDKKAIAAANGVGPKTAARIVLELKDKIAKSSPYADDEDSDIYVATQSKSSKLSDAVDALVALGYSRNEASSALRTIDADKYEIDDMIRLALKKLMR